MSGFIDLLTIFIFKVRCQWMIEGRIDEVTSVSIRVSALGSASSEG